MQNLRLASEAGAWSCLFYETGPCVFHVVRQLSGSACSSRRELRFDDVTDQTLRPFDEGQMVGEAALEQHTNAMVTGKIGGSDQRNVFRCAHVAQVIGLCQYEEPLRLRGLDLRKLLAKILDKHIVQPSGEVHRFLSDDFERFVQLR
jgi:hypothetical protein